MRRALSFLLALFLLWGLTASASANALIVYRHAGNGDKKRVALTFDDGPHPLYTPQILDILSKFDVNATFFVVGENAKAHPELVRRAKAEGHEIANHTYRHYHVKDLANEALTEEILCCSRLILEITGEAPRYFRPPEGICSAGVKDFCRKNGMTIVLWNVDTRDWAHTPVEQILANVQENVTNGSIILMHDFIGKNSPTPSALGKILPMLLESGYEFVTVSQLLQG